MLQQCCRKRKKNSVKSALSKVRLDLLNSKPAIIRLVLKTGDTSLCDHVFSELEGSYPNNTIHNKDSDGSVCVCVCVCVFSRSVMSESATPWTVARQVPLSLGFPRQDSWSGLPFRRKACRVTDERLFLC